MGNRRQLQWLPAIFQWQCYIESDAFGDRTSRAALAARRRCEVGAGSRSATDCERQCGWVGFPYNRNPARCQPTTVLGVTPTKGFVHPGQNVFNAIQNSLCGAASRGRDRWACRVSNCRRRTRFSRTRFCRELKAPTIQPRKCRSDRIVAAIMSRILSKQAASGSSSSRSFRECTRF